MFLLNVTSIVTVGFSVGYLIIAYTAVRHGRYLFRQNKKIEEENDRLSEEILEQNKLISSNEARLSSFDTIIPMKMQANERSLKDIEFSYEQQKQEIEKSFILTREEKEKELTNIQSKLEVLQNAYQVRVQSAIVEELARDEKRFYQIQISELDIKDIETLKEVVLLLSNQEVINKAIWKIYLEKETNNLCARVGTDKVSGVYKITNILNDKIYIGQAVNVKDRWRQHIKRGVGAETVTGSAIYPAMAESGVWNFTFELLEKCDKKQLNEREKYWIGFYNSNAYGYNLTAGNK